ncbi:MAG: HAD family hydrolase [Synergistaceae bacterium]|nr:HAD family hydrolase [Synergistaceae bacterium]
MTIVDSSYVIAAAINETANSLGKPCVTRQTVLKFAALSLEDFLREIWGEWRREWIDLYREKAAPLEYEIRPFPGVPRVLTALRERGIFLAVASNRYNPRAAMDKSKTSRYFHAVVGPIDGLPRKPNPAMLENLMERFGVARSETLYVGDSDVDLEAGFAAGVRTVGVTTGDFSRAQLEKLGAWRVIDSIESLLPIVAGYMHENESENENGNGNEEEDEDENIAGGECGDLRKRGCREHAAGK